MTSGLSAVRRGGWALAPAVPAWLAAATSTAAEAGGPASPTITLLSEGFRKGLGCRKFTCRNDKGWHDRENR